MSTVTSKAELSLPDGWVQAPMVTQELLVGTFWSFGPLGQAPYTPFLVLAPDRLLGNHYRPDEDLWQVVNGRLQFVSGLGLPTTTFDMAQVMGQGIAALAGREHGSEALHVLIPVNHPPHPVHPISPTPPDHPRVANFLEQLPPGTRRPNLVVLRAGETSLHPKWFATMGDGRRNWDFCISYYGKDVEAVRGTCEYLTHQPTQWKLQALFDIFHPGSPLWDYEYIWLPDDDLDLRGSDINRIFYLSRRHGLDLAQPAIAKVPGSFQSHAICTQQPTGGVRLTNFVEGMCPVFSRRALRICHGTLKETWYGADILWPALLGRPSTRIGIMDEIAVVHTRPQATNYNKAAADVGLNQVLAAYHYKGPWLADIGLAPR